MNLKPKQLFIILVVVSLIGILVSTGVSAYFLIFKQTPAKSINLPTPPPTTKPTPTYQSLIDQPADYVGTIESIDGTESITLLRQDGSRAVLQLNPNIPIYEIVDPNQTPPQVYVRRVSSLSPGQTLSVYTEQTDIIAIFASPK